MPLEWFVVKFDVVEVYGARVEVLIRGETSSGGALSSAACQAFYKQDNEKGTRK